MGYWLPLRPHLEMTQEPTTARGPARGEGSVSSCPSLLAQPLGHLAGVYTSSPTVV